MTEQSQEQVDTGVIEEEEAPLTAEAKGAPLTEEEKGAPLTASEEQALKAADLKPGETTTENPVTAAPAAAGEGLSMDSSKEEIQEAARAHGKDDSGTKQEILDRLNE